MTRRTYDWAARWYDRLSGEGLVYRAGRVAGVSMLGLREGDVVLDLGCGTGLSFPLLAGAVGPAGRIIGMDATPSMLDVARARTSRSATPVTLLVADATDGSAPAWARVGAAGVDAVISTYSLSLMENWPEAWDLVLGHVPVGTRIAVVDLGLPTGAARPLAPLARLACWVGGSDPRAAPWRAVETDCDEVERRELRGGHIQVAAGTTRAGQPSG